MTYVPTPFATPVISPQALTAFGATPYISPSWYKFAPTSVSTGSIVPGSSSPQSDSIASLASVIQRASTWIDDQCFHSDGSFVAQPITESMWVTPKPSGQLVLITNFRPVREVLGVAVGCAPSQLADISPQAALDISTGMSTITLPGYWTSASPQPMFSGFPNANGQVFCVYTYVSGYPHMSLATTATAGASSITVNPPSPGDTFPYDVFPGTALVIKDGPQWEQVVVSAMPTSLTLHLTAPLQYTHIVPPVPDSIMVSGLPWSVEQACILITNVLIKTQGFRAFILPGVNERPTTSSRKAMGQAGITGDWHEACKLLRPYQKVMLHS